MQLSFFLDGWGSGCCSSTHTPHYKGAVARSALTTAPFTIVKAYFLLLKVKLAIYTCAGLEAGMVILPKNVSRYLDDPSCSREKRYPERIAKQRFCVSTFSTVQLNAVLPGCDSETLPTQDKSASKLNFLQHRRAKLSCHERHYHVEEVPGRGTAQLCAEWHVSQKLQREVPHDLLKTALHPLFFTAAAGAPNKAKQTIAPPCYQR